MHPNLGESMGVAGDLRMNWKPLTWMTSSASFIVEACPSSSIMERQKFRITSPGREPGFLSNRIFPGNKSPPNIWEKATLPKELTFEETKLEEQKGDFNICNKYLQSNASYNWVCSLSVDSICECILTEWWNMCINELIQEWVLQ